MLLVITNKTDLACDYLIVHLKKRQVPFLRINTEDLGRQFAADLIVGDGNRDFLLTKKGHRPLSASDVSAVYFRQPLLPLPPDDIAQSDVEFAKREAGECLRSLWRLIDEKRWVNHPRRLWLASNKIEQLCIAQELGMEIPPTIVTANKDSVGRFIEFHGGDVICKAVKHGFMYAPGSTSIATTQRIGSDYLDNFEDFASVPMTYQREIPKVYDVRVTVVGEDVFATAIHSQEFAETQVDWRVWDLCDFDLEHERIELPNDVVSRCLRITARNGLKYAAIDLVYCTDGSYYFLELNPNGQWAWIEQITGYPIRRSLLHCMGYA